MESKAEPTQNNYCHNINRLVRFFTKTTGGYAFASIKDQRYIATINKSLQHSLAEHNIELMVFNFDTESDTPLVEQLRQATAHNGAVVVNNLGQLAEMRNGLLTTRGADNIQTLNFAREQLLLMHTPILFWASHELLGIIGNRAADLHTQRSITTVFFDDEISDSLPEPALESRFLPDYRQTPDYEALDLKIKLLKRQMADATAANYPIATIANNLALPLAKVYSEIDLHDEAKALFIEYQSYFDGQNIDTIINLGDIANNAKDYERAIGYYKEALKTEGDLEVEFAHTYVYSKLGDIYIEVGELDNALHYYTLYADLSNQYSKAYPQNELLKVNLATSYSKLGKLYNALGKLDKVLSYFTLYSNLNKALSEGNQRSETHKLELATSYGMLGDLHQDLGDSDKALNYYLLCNNLFKELNETNQKNEQIKNNLAISHERLGEIYKTLEDLDKALFYLTQASYLLKALSDSNPKDEQIKNNLAISYSKLGGLHQAMGEIDKALNFYILNTELSKTLYESNPKKENIKINLAISYGMQGNLYYSLGEFDKALSFYKPCFEISKALSESNLKNIGLIEVLAISNQMLAKTYKAKGDDKKGQEYFKEFQRLANILTIKVPQVPKYKEWNELKY